MELLLNFAWICISATLVGWQVRSIRAKQGQVDWRGPIALGVLLLTLLPVVSVTDDLMSMAAAADVEHMFRRPLEPAQQAPLLAVVELLGAAALLLHGLHRQRLPETISGSDVGRVRLLRGLVRVCSVRPPPTAISL